MIRRIPALLMTILFASGCATATSREESWTYMGSDQSLRGGPSYNKERREEMAAEARSNPGAPVSERAQRAFQADMAEWQAWRASIALREKEACIRETGDSGIPSVWTGYSDRLVACMKARGWWPGRLSDPL